MESLVDELTCPVCLDLYDGPVLLPCAHSLCKRCAEKVFAPSKKHPPPRTAGRTKGKAPKDQHAECPSCRHKFQLPDLGVDGLRRNTTLQNIVDRYREAKKSSEVPKAVPCEMCDKEQPNNAVKTCPVCNISYCEACLSTFHPMRGGLARHTLTEPSAATPQILMCTEHAQEKVNMYCETDRCLICSLCKLVGKHKDHKVAAVSDMFQQKKGSICARVAGLIQQNAEVDCFVDKIEQTMTKTEQNCADIKRTVETFAEKLTAIIMKRKTMLQARVEVEKDQKLNTLGQQRDNWAHTGMDMSAAIAEAEALLNEEDPITFLQASKSLEDRMAAFASLKERKLNTTDQFIHNTIAVSNLEQKVSSLDFQRAPESPKILSDRCTAGRDHISVWWTAGGNTPVDKYNVCYRQAYQSKGPQNVYTVYSPCNSLKLPNLEDNTTYSVAVVAVNATGIASSQHVYVKTRRGGWKFKLDKSTTQAPMTVSDDSMSVTRSTTGAWGYASHQVQGYSRVQGHNPVQGYTQGQGFNQPLTCVMGDVGIDTGQRYWEVDVKGSSNFGIGVGYHNISLNSSTGTSLRQQSQAPVRLSSPFRIPSPARHQCMMNASCVQVCSNGDKKYNITWLGMVEAGVDQSTLAIGSSTHLTKVGILLNYNDGTISFYDQNHSLLTSQTQKLSQPVYPCLVVNDQWGTLTLVRDCVWPKGLE